MHVVFKAVEDMTETEMRAAYRLTMKNGDMRPMLRECRSVNSSYVGNVALVFDGPKMVGWALAFKNPNWYSGKKRTVYIYISPDYRRLGWGSYLYKDMRIRYKTFNVAPWDSRSAQFFLTHKLQPGDENLALSYVGG